MEKCFDVTAGTALLSHKVKSEEYKVAAERQGDLSTRPTALVEMTVIRIEYYFTCGL